MCKHLKKSTMTECQDIVLSVLDTANLGDVERELYVDMLIENIDKGMSYAAATKTTIQTIIDENGLNIDFTYREILYVCDKTIVG